jgi:hypothetical protein
MEEVDAIDLMEPEDDTVELQGVIYCVASDCVVILFKVDNGRQGRVAIPLR